MATEITLAHIMRRTAVMLQKEEPPEAFVKWMDLTWPGLKTTGDRYQLAWAGFKAGALYATGLPEFIAELDREKARRIEEWNP